MGCGHGQADRAGAPARGFGRGAVFNRDESRILTWSSDETARLWDMGVDLDFSIEDLKIELMAMTGSEFNPVMRQLNSIDLERWRAIRREYVELASNTSKSAGSQPPTNGDALPQTTPIASRGQILRPS